MAEAAAAIFHFSFLNRNRIKENLPSPAHFFLVIGQFQFCFIESFDVFPDYPFLSCFMHQHRLMRLVIDHKMLHWKTVCKMLPDQTPEPVPAVRSQKTESPFQLPESQKFTTVPCLPPGFSRHPENAKNGRMLQCMDELFPGYAVSASTIIL